MKKFFITLLILLLAAGAVFYIGWMQLQINTNEIVILHTKTGGWDSEPLSSDVFTWRWENLIPTNVTIHRIPIDARRLPVSISSTIKSAAAVIQKLDSNLSFNYELTGIIRYQIDSQTALTMTKNGISIDESWYIDLEDSINSTIHNTLLLSEPQTPKAFNDLIADTLARDFPEIAVGEIRVSNFSIPDYSLYNDVKKVYIQSLQDEREIQKERALLDLQASAPLIDEITRLEEYGKLIEEYPKLLDFLKIDGQAQDSIAQ